MTTTTLLLFNTIILCLCFHVTEGMLIPLRPQTRLSSHRCSTAVASSSSSSSSSTRTTQQQQLQETQSMEFLHHVQKVPLGELTLEDAQLLRQTLSSTTEQVVVDPIAQSELLLRMIREWQVIITSEQQQQQQQTEMIQQFLKPTLQDFLVLFDLWETTLAEAIRRKHKDDMTQAAHYTQQLYTAALTNIHHQDLHQPTVIEQVLRILASSRARGIDRVCRSIFDNSSSGVVQQQQPTLSMYHSLITALSQSRDKGAAHRAETFLRQAVELYPPTTDGGGITIDTFNVVMTAWAKSGFQYGPERAEKLIYLMDELDQQHLGGRGLFRPSVFSFTSLLDAYAQTLEWESVSQAERIFNRLLDEYLETKQQDLEPNVATWTIVLSAWAKLSRKNNRGAASRANRLLERMESLYKEGRISFGPDAIVFISTMNAWAFSKTTEGPQRATDILLEMYERYLDGDDSMKPSAKNIRVVLEAWIGSEDVNAMERAEKLLDAFVDHLDAMVQQEPSDEAMREAVTDVYRTMLFGWSKRDKPRQAHDYLLDMVENNLNVDSFCFDRIIETYTRVNHKDAMVRSQEVFDLMENCREKGLLKPNERLYSSYIRAMVKAGVPDVASKTYALLSQMKELYSHGNLGIKPTVFTYNAVLMACAATSKENDSKQRAGAFKIAISLFNELRTGKGDLAPDHVSFGNLLQCANLLPPSEQKDSLIRSTFGLCCKSGYVNTFVLRDFQSVASDELWVATMKCPPGTEVNIDRLPASWRRMTQPKRPAEQQSRAPFRKSRR